MTNDGGNGGAEEVMTKESDFYVHDNVNVKNRASRRMMNSNTKGIQDG
jgi:hypothetical protein